MSFFSMFLGGKGFDAYVEEANEVDGTFLDVRTPGEFQDGHLQGALNIPLNDIERTAKKVKDKSTPLYVYCRSGSRSSFAVRALQSMGYTNVTDIGGIMMYRGAVVRGK